MSSVDSAKPKSLSRIESKLQTLDENTFRYRVLETCRRFKTTWIELGQALFQANRDKSYMEWGFLTFEGYCSQELGIKKGTALKLLRSYQFLEDEEPKALEQALNGPATEKYPDLDSVHLLRLAKNNKNIDEKDYERIRKKVMEDVREPDDVRKEVKMLTERAPQRESGDLRAERRVKFLNRVVRAIEQMKLEAMANKFLPGRILDNMDKLSEEVEREINRD